MNSPTIHTTPQLSRFETAKREQKRRLLAENPQLLEETIANHYTAHATLALRLRRLVDMRKDGGTGWDRAIADCLAALRGGHVADFGTEPAWATDDTE